MEDQTSGNPDIGKISLLVSDHVTAMLAYWDNRQVCRFANNAYIEWFGRSKEEMIGKITMKELLGPLYEKNLPFITGALAGHKQIFEREIPLSNGSIRNSLATYIPDIENGKVNGFFVHVADVTYVKELEKKLLRSKQEMLRNVIEAQEKERIDIEHILNENVSQMLVYSKMLISHKKTNSNTDINEKILQSLNHAIGELKALSINLTPTAIKHFGFLIATEDYIENLKVKHPVEILFEYADKQIEELDIEDKLSIFRIIQSFLLIITTNLLARMICIKINYTSYHLVLTLAHNDKTFIFPTGVKEFMDIRQRVEYYGGNITEPETATEKILKIELKFEKKARNPVS